MDKTEVQNKVDGVVIGVITSIASSGEPMVAFSGNQSELPLRAKSTVEVSADFIGREVALLFEGGDVSKPIVMGLIHKEMDSQVNQHIELRKTEGVMHGVWNPTKDNEAKVDGERIQITAKKEIVLKCGKSSITMTRAGKVIIRGTYISTRSSGANRIKGGSVQIN